MREIIGKLPVSTAGEPLGDVRIDTHNYVICRILGNELPPRDIPGSRLEVFEYILQNEYLPPEAKRVWFINRIIDTELAQAIKKRLQEHGERFVEFGIDWNAYGRAAGRTAKLNALIALNNARNDAFRFGASLADFVVLLDGDCYFDEKNWVQTFNQIQADQQLHPQRKYYAVPSARTFIGQEANIAPHQLEEPMLVMRSDATQLFDESKPFGNASKTSLLRTLGLSVLVDKWYPLNSEGPCLVVGSVLHLGTGSQEVEEDGWVRYIQRRESLNRLLRTSDTIAARALLSESLKHFVVFRLRCFSERFREDVTFLAQRTLFKIKFPLRKLLE